MRILFSADWQVDGSNLHLCKKLQERILNVCDEYEIAVFVHCGDFKQQYSPIDVEAANFAVNFIKAIPVPFYICKGNHDRIGLYNDDRHWLDVLEAAGAMTFSEASPTSIKSSELFYLCFLPFYTNTEELRKNSDILAKSVKNERFAARDSRILIFHQEIKGAKLSSTVVSENGIAPGVLHPEAYDYCIGGHIHGQQNVVGNIWYVGSPFCHDWGEANQEKYFLMFDSKTKKLTRIPTGFPGWYDPALPGYKAPANFKGAKIRLTHPEKGSLSDSEVKELGQKYPGAELTFRASPKIEQQVVDGIDPNIPDKNKIAAYIKRNPPQGLPAQAVFKYMLGVLSRTQAASGAIPNLKFLGFNSINALSYKELDFAYEPGLTVIRGINQYQGSNGSGKTNLLAMPSIALFGTTFKGQKYNRWIHRWAPKEESAVELIFEADGKKCSVFRSRNPGKLELTWDDADDTPGNRQEAIQKHIESKIGFSWETFANSLYIDQKRENLMLSGRDSERKSFLARMYNLERFSIAQKYVKEKLSEVNEQFEALSVTVSNLRHSLTVYQSSIESMKAFEPTDNPEDFSEKIAKGKQKIAELLKQKSRFEKPAQKLTDYQDKVDENIRLLTLVKGDLEGSMVRLGGLEGEKICPTCLGPISEKHVKQHIDTFDKQLQDTDAKIKSLLDKRIQAAQAVTKMVRQVNVIAHSIVEISSKVSLYESQLTAAKRQSIDNQRREEMLARTEKSLAEVVLKISEAEAEFKKLAKQIDLLNYVSKAFGRDGIPSFLLATLVPQLNKAAQFYSETFASGAIQVRFIVTPDGDVDVTIDNPQGGEFAEDQSGGEMRLASLIVSFALREAAPKTNLLILDEPGDGLDQVWAPQFARGLHQVAKRFGTILITTHNPILLSELAAERTITIEKKNGVSRIVEV